MNPFAEHAQNMNAYEEFCSEPVAENGNENSITVESGPLAGSYTAVVGQFIRADIFINGGVSPHLVGEIIVQKSALPQNALFPLGLSITAYPIGGGCHRCQVLSVHNTFTEWRLQLWDRFEGA